MSDALARVIMNTTKSVRFVSNTRPIHMTVQVKETRDRIIVTRKLRVNTKYYKKIEIIDIPTD